MFQPRRENNLPGWLWFFLILPMVLIVALLYKKRRLPRIPRLNPRGVQRYVEPDSIPLDMSDARQISVQTEPAEPFNGPEQPGSQPAPAQSDDLKIIEGIGPAIERLLFANGIHTFRDLADAPIERLVGILIQAKLNRLADPGTWAEQAHLAAEGKWEDLAALQGILKAGKRIRPE